MKKFRFNFIVSIVILISLFFNGCASLDTSKKVTPFSEKDFEAIYPKWHYLKNVELFQDINMVFMIKESEGVGDGYAGKLNVAVIKFNENKWEEVWSLPNNIGTDYYGLDENYLNTYIKDVQVIKNNKKALLTSVLGSSGNRGVNSAITVLVDSEGNCELKFINDAFQMELLKDEKESKIVLSADINFGQIEFYLKDNKYNEKHIKPSEVRYNNATPIEFTLDENNLIEPVKEDVVELDVNDSIYFVPIGEKAKQAIDNGDIEIYSASDGAPLNTSMACYVYRNFCTFKEPGVQKFLVAGKGYSKNVPVNFIFRVGLKKNNDYKKVIEKSGKIKGIDLGIGSTYEHIIELLGEPDYEDFFEGSYYLKYKDLSFFFLINHSKISSNNDKYTPTQEKVYAVSGSKDWKICGIKTGTKLSDVEKLLGKPTQKIPDESGDLLVVYYEFEDKRLELYFDKNKTLISGFLGKQI